MKLLMWAAAFIALAGQAQQARVASARGAPQVDIGKLVSRADIAYERPVARSEEGLPVGNGRMGSLVWTQPAMLKLQINRVDVFANGCATNSFPERHTDYCGGCGFVDIDFAEYGNEVFPGRRTVQRLSVHEGLVTVEGDGVTARILAWNEQDVMAAEVTDLRAKAGIISVNLRSLRNLLIRIASHTAASSLSARDGRIVLKQEFAEDDYYNGSALAIGVIGRRSEVRRANDQELRLVVEPGKGSFTVLMATSSSFNRRDDVVASALRQLEAAAANGTRSLRCYAGEGFWSLPRCARG